MKTARNRISKLKNLLLLVLLVFSTNCEKNLAPIIQSIDANPTELEAGGQALLMVVASDPDGDPLIYLWETSGGEIATDNSQSSITWNAPVESGSYFCTVSVNDGTEIVTDSIQITVSEDPVLSIDRDTLYFDTDRNLEIFTISNLGTGLLDWTLQYSTNDGGSWIKQVSPDQGATAKDNPVSVEVVIDRSGLSGGSYLGAINISSDDKSAKVHILVEVAELVVKPSTLNFGSSETNKSITLENGGAGNLNYDITVSDNWISVDPSSGGLTSQQEVVDVQVDRTGKAPGLYNGQIIIASNAGELVVPVQMAVEEGPILHVVPIVLDFGESDSNRSFSIQNVGGGTLNWSISESLNWLVVSPANGSTTSEKDDIQLTADRTVLASGTHSGKIIVSSDGGNTEITVNIEVIQNPVLQINTNILDFGLTVPSRSFFIQNAGGGTLNWTISESLEWLTVDPVNGSTVATGTDNIHVVVDRSVLTHGSHSGKIYVNSNGGNSEITINIEVEQEPVLKLSPTELDFGTAATSLSFTIVNDGGKTLNWKISESLDWLVVSPAEGTTTTETETIQVTVDRSVLSSGGFSDVITVSSNGGDAEIKVSLQVEATGEWLKYDDDHFEGHYDTDAKHLFFLTQFDRPSDWKKFKITKLAISFPPLSGNDNIELFCFSTQEISGNHWPYQSLFQTSQVDPGGGWNVWTVDWGLDLDRFCVGYRQIEEKAPSVHYDKNANMQRSYYVNTDMRGFHVDDINWAIRVYVEKTDGEPVPAKWLDIIVKPVIGQSIDKTRLVPDKNKPL